MSVLVAGGAGYIGSHIARALIERGEDVVIVDSLKTGHREAIAPEARFYEGDIRDRQFLDSIFDKEEIESVIHFAASSLVGVSMKEPLEYYDNNLYGTLQLLRAMQRAGCARIVFSSTAAAYGEPESVPIREEDRTKPTNPYGETKLAMEKLFFWAAQAAGPRYVSLRYFNACGAAEDASIGEDHNPETHLIPLILQVALGKREKICVFGDDYPTRDGTCIRDYIHVEDLADAHLLALDYLREGNDSDIFNLGSGEGFSVLEMIDAARDVTGHDIPLEMAGRRAGDPAVLIASSEKARKVLGWKPKKDEIRVIVEDAWRWHSTHPEGYGDQHA